MHKLNTKKNRPLDVAPECRTKRFSWRLWPGDYFWSQGSDICRQAMSPREISAPRSSVTDPFYPLLSVHKLLQWQLHTENIFDFIYVVLESFLIRTRIKIDSCYGTTRPSNFETEQLER